MDLLAETRTRTGDQVARPTAPAVETDVRQVYLAHFGRLAGWAGSLVGDRDLGHDLATEAFVRLLRHWQDVEEPRPWLYATVANLVRDHWRKRGREASAYEKYQVGAPADPDVAGPAADPENTLDVRAAVAALPERLRSPVLLYYYADLTVGQVARQLGKSEGAIKRDLYDARALLARVLEANR